MQTYTIATPPALPGIYGLINQKTRQIYIGATGDLCMRHYQWSRTFSIGKPSWLTQRGNTLDWKFVVLFELPGLSREELFKYEARAIQHARKQGYVLMNISVPLLSGLEPPEVLAETPRGKRGRPRKTTVVDDAGTELTYAEVAQRLGTGMKGLYSRLKQYRDRGVTVVRYGDLEHYTQKFRKVK